MWAARSRGDRVEKEEVVQQGERGRRNTQRADLGDAVGSCHQTRFILRSTWRTPREDQIATKSLRYAFLASRDVAVVDSDRYDRDRESRTVRQDGGRLGERQNAVHQESAGLSWDQERSLRGLHGTVLFRTYLYFFFVFFIDTR